MKFTGINRVSIISGEVGIPACVVSARCCVFSIYKDAGKCIHILTGCINLFYDVVEGFYLYDQLTTLAFFFTDVSFPMLFRE